VDYYCFKLIVSALLLCVFVPSGESWALPVERFDSRLRISCAEGKKSCSGSVRDVDTLGRITGFSISKSAAGKAKLELASTDKGRLSFSAKDVSDVALTITWDGDLNPDLLSASGLNCFDLTSQSGYAFIASQASLRSTCAEPSIAGGCPSFSMETRVYNASDPTGQRFSASVVTRSMLDETDITIPFSNFVRQGPRGQGSFSCAGAVTMVLRFRGFSELEFTTGPIYTNGAGGLTRLPTPSLQPTLEGASTLTLGQTGTYSPTPEQQQPSTTASPAAQPIGGDLLTTSIQTPGGTAQPSPFVTASDITPPGTPSAVAAPQATETPKGQQKSRSSAPEEAVYGELVAD